MPQLIYFSERALLRSYKDLPPLTELKSYAKIQCRSAYAGIEKTLSWRFNLQAPSFLCSVEIGTYDNMGALLDCPGSGVEVAWLKDRFLRSVPVSPKRVPVHLWAADLTGLGLKGGRAHGLSDSYLIRDVHHAIVALGFRLCPAEIAPQLCLQYKVSEPSLIGQALHLLMPPIVDEGGFSSGFCVVVRDSGRLSITSYCANPDRDWFRSRTLVLFAGPPPEGH